MSPIVMRRPRVSVATIAEDGSVEELQESVNPNAAAFSYRVRSTEQDIAVGMRNGSPHDARSRK